MIILAKRGEPTPQYGWVGLGIAVAGVGIFMFDKRGGDSSVLGNFLSLGRVSRSRFTACSTGYSSSAIKRRPTRRIPYWPEQFRS
jgi:hypothetical protein